MTPNDVRSRVTEALLVGLSASIGLAALHSPAAAQGTPATIVCVRPRGTLVLRERCRRREHQLNLAPSGGASLHPYGDGSAGANVVTGDVPLADPNLQYTDFTVGAGARLTVPSGTVIRCTGTFTNNGRIEVEPAVPGYVSGTAATDTIDSASAPAEPGVSLRSAGAGEFAIAPGGAPNGRLGGVGGKAVSEIQARAILAPGAKGGGGAGGGGGGTFTVLCRSAVLNAGTIVASGGSGHLAPDVQAGGGGGGGGIVILASSGSVSNTGTITARGGDGDESNFVSGPGGGGGGGIVHLIGTDVTDSGLVDVGAGAAGTLGATGSMLSNTRAGGGGGGACGGNGGRGGGTTGGLPGDPQAAEAGALGLVLQTAADPAGLF
jgi:hypothetical protein